MIYCYYLKGAQLADSREERREEPGEVPHGGEGLLLVTL